MMIIIIIAVKLPSCAAVVAPLLYLRSVSYSLEATAESLTVVQSGASALLDPSEWALSLESSLKDGDLKRFQVRLTRCLSS